jgi:pyruvate/2-oxoacid:ferredoxin oxidoreductase alpha subunit
VHSIEASMTDSLRRGLKIAAPRVAAALVLWALGTAAGCAHHEYFPGTTILRSDENRKIIETVEEYRQRLLTRNTVGLLALASQKYFEDSGTPRSDDDYGYDGLKKVLEVRLQRVKSLRYEIEYRNIRVTGDQAEVEVFLDGSFELAAAEAGDRYRRVNDYHRFMLEKEGDEWKFLGGM